MAGGTVRKSGDGREIADPAQIETCRRLAKHEPRAEEAYLGALHALRQDDYPDRLVHAAHSLREIIDIMSRLGQSADERTKPLDATKRKLRLQKLFDPLTLRVPRMDDKCDELVIMYRRLSGIAHHDSATAEDLEDILARLEEAFEALDSPQLTINKEMDDILARQPSEEPARRLTGMQHRWATQLRLAESLPCKWLPYMKEAGYFSEPQPADASNPSSYPVWPPSLYLRRCTKRFGSDTTEIILAAKFRGRKERNPAVYMDFLACACDLPLPDAEKIAAKALREGWVDFTDIIMRDRGYLELAKRLYLGGRHGTAAEMLHSALKAKMRQASKEDTGKSEPQRFVGPMEIEWFVKELREKMSPLAQSCPWPIMDMLGRFLDEVAALDAQKEKQADKIEEEDDAVSRLLDCGPSRGNMAWPSFRRQMVDFVASFVVECIRSYAPRTPDGMAQLKQVMGVFYKGGHTAFRRIELSAYAEFPREFGREIETAVLMHFDMPDTYNEWCSLLGISFGGLSQQARLEVLRRIDVGPSQDWLDGIEGYWGEDKARAVEKNWRLRHLHLIKEHLEGEHLAAHSRLLEEMGEPEPPGRMRPSVEFPDAEQGGGGTFAGKSVGEVFEHMSVHGKSVDEFFERKSVGIEFEEYVKSNPEVCSKRAYEARLLEPAALRYLLLGLDGALREGGNIDWDGALRLIEHAAAAEHASRPALPESTLSAMCGLVERGLKGDLIGMDMRERVWGIIEAFVEIGTKRAADKHARQQGKQGAGAFKGAGYAHRERSEGHKQQKMPESAAERSGAVAWVAGHESSSSLDESLNGIDGVSFHAVYQYAAWCERHGEERGDFAPEARRVFDSYLDRKMGPHSAGRHAVLGVFLPSFYRFDHEWAKSLPPRAASGKEAKAAFWESYVVWNDLHTHVFKDLSRWYHEFTKKNTMGRANERWSERTIMHAMLAHLYCLEGADKPVGNLLGGSDETLQECARQTSIIMRGKADDPDFDKERLAALWKDPGLARCDLGMWLVNSPLDRRDTIALYRDYVAGYPGGINLYTPIKHLAAYARDFPEEVAECLDTLVGMCDGYVPNQVQDVLTLLRGSDSEAVKEKCRAIDEKLARRGREWGS